MQHLDKTFMMLFKVVFNESLWVDLNIGDIIGSSILCKLHKARQIHQHFERKFDKERSLNVNEVELEFKAKIDTSQPFERYFKCQQQFRNLLEETKEPICEVSMAKSQFKPERLPP